MGQAQDRNVAQPEFDAWKDPTPEHHRERRSDLHPTGDLLQVCHKGPLLSG
jgi:hypothetical protein